MTAVQCEQILANYFTVTTVLADKMFISNYCEVQYSSKVVLHTLLYAMVNVKTLINKLFLLKATCYRVMLCCEHLPSPELTFL